MKGLKPYQGNEPYVFISYAHADEQAVGEVLEHLEQSGVRFWFDDGIEPGSEWPEYIAERLASADLMLAFISNAYARSNNCRKEMHYAVSKGIRTINIFLEDARLTPGMALQIGNIFALMKYRMEEHRFYDRLDQALQNSPESESAEKGAERSGSVGRKPSKPAGGKRKGPRRKLLPLVLGILLALALFCGICFVPAAVSAARSVTVSREEALAAAQVHFKELVGEEAAKSYYVDYIHMRLRHDGSLFNGVYIYNVEYQDQNGTEYKIEVNAASGNTVIRDID